MPISHILRIPPNKAFGFIKGIGRDEDYFFHRDDTDYDWETLRKECINQNQVNVQFEIKANGEKGLRAINVKRV